MSSRGGNIGRIEVLHQSSSRMDSADLQLAFYSSLLKRDRIKIAIFLKSTIIPEFSLFWKTVLILCVSNVHHEIYHQLLTALHIQCSVTHCDVKYQIFV